MKLLITGASGLLGSALTRAAAGGLGQELALDPIPLDRHALDITDADAVRRALARIRPGAVVNCGAFSSVDAAQDAPEEALAVNRDGARNLAAAAADVGAHFIHISTDYVFDGSKRTPYLPTDQPAPLSLYGISKLAGEVAVREAHPGALILRTSWIFGEGGQGFVAWARRALAEDGPPLRVVEDERSRPTWSRDLAEGILALLARRTLEIPGRRILGIPVQQPTGCLHLANTGDCSRLELAREIRAILGSDRKIIGVSAATFGAPARRPAYSVLDLTETEGVLGRRLPPWQEALRRYILDRPE